MLTKNVSATYVNPTAPIVSPRRSIYDHSRFVATTFNHVEGTPLDRVPVARDALETLIELG